MEHQDGPCNCLARQLQVGPQEVVVKMRPNVSHTHIRPHGQDLQVKKLSNLRLCGVLWGVCVVLGREWPKSELN